MSRSVLALCALLLSGAAHAQGAGQNVILFVADGLRPGMVNAANTPTIAALLERGVRFSFAHSMFPTFTTANAASLATGHKVGDTGDFSNTIYTGFKVAAAADSMTPFIETDPVLREIDAFFKGDYLNQKTVMRAALERSVSTATIGKVGPTLIFDHQIDAAGGSRGSSIVIDDQTGGVGVPLAEDVQQALQAAGLPLKAVPRGDNGKSGDFRTPGTLEANVAQQAFFLDAATKAVLPLFKARGKPFMLVYWSRDPDGTQHSQGDSLGRLVPGINGPTSLAAIRNADANLAGLLAALRALGLEPTTNVIVTADHGFSTASKESSTSFAATQSYADVSPRLLPPGFMAIDLAHGLGLPLADPDAKYAVLPDGAHPGRGNGVIGADKDRPRVVVASNGGSDLVYLPDGDPALAREVVELLAAQDYVSGLFVADSLGFIPGTLPLSAIDLKGSAVTPVPAIVVNFRSFATGCADPETCAVEVADTPLQQGQGIHGSFSRADTAIFGGAAGPAFRTGFVDTAPTSNADIGRTMAHLLGVDTAGPGDLTGRVLTEALRGGAMPEWRTEQRVSPQPDTGGRVTVVQSSVVGTTRYFDAAGYPGRTLGLRPPGAR